MTKKKNGDRGNRDWDGKIIPAAATIVRRYQPTLITVRQLWYLLVSLPADHAGRLPNIDTVYHQMTAKGAAGRRAGIFPQVRDNTRSIRFPATWSDEAAGIRALANQWRNNRSRTQPYQLWIVTEKETLVAQLLEWFGIPLHIPVVALRGSTTEPIERAIMRRVRQDGRPAILIYLGDHDPAGWRILWTFVQNTGCWDNPEHPDHPDSLDAVIGHTAPAKKESLKRPIPNYRLIRKFRFALMPEQARAMGLERNSSKEDDPNNQSFALNFPDELDDDGNPVQIELDAVEPNTLRNIVQAAIDTYWNDDAYQQCLRVEERQRGKLKMLQDNIAEAIAYLHGEWPDEGGPIDEDGHAVNERGQRIDEDGLVIEEDGDQDE